MTGYDYNKKWRKKYPKKWLNIKKKYYDQFIGNNQNTKQKYTIEEIKLICSKRIADRDISKQIGRSVRAIQAVRSRLKNRKNNVIG